MQTRILSADEGVGEAVKILRAGGVVGFPTETVYGLGADARQEDAVRRIYEVKGRPAGNPVIVHVAGANEARSCAADWPDVAEKLVERFWPGPLTVIVKRGGEICPLVSAGRETVALRCPSHPGAMRLLREFSGPVAAPSANRSGFTSPTTAAHVLAELGGRVELILDGGTCEIGLESTVVDVSGAAGGKGRGATVLRPGAVTVEMLRQVVGGAVEIARKTVLENESAESPGTHWRHYAPRTVAYRFDRAEWDRVQAWAKEHGPVAVLTYRDDVILTAPHETIRMPAEAGAYARVLYGAIREADERQVKAMLVLVPEREDGMWAAVCDRLSRATVPWTL